MGLYDKYLLPRLLDLAMRKAELGALRAEWVPQARGEVLEVGVGSGLNLIHYTKDVVRVLGVDPSQELQRMARERAAKARVPVEFVTQSAEAPLPLAPNSVDTVVFTWTLCSIPDPVAALTQMRRVVKPSGRLIFIEHGLAVDPKVVRWQNRLNPLWKIIGGGCNLNRDVNALVEGAGFKIRSLQTSHIPGPRPMTYMYRGYAEPA